MELPRGFEPWTYALRARGGAPSRAQLVASRHFQTLWGVQNLSQHRRSGANRGARSPALSNARLASWGFESWTPSSLHGSSNEQPRAQPTRSTFRSPRQQGLVERTDTWEGAQWGNSRLETAKRDSWLDGVNSAPLSFVDFGGLSDIVISQWAEFEDLVPSQHWLKQTVRRT